MRSPTCTANRFSNVQITVQYRCIFVLLFERYSMQLDNNVEYPIGHLLFFRYTLNICAKHDGKVGFNSVEYASSLSCILIGCISYDAV